MIEIRPYLFLGTQGEARNERELKERKITHLLCVASGFRYPKDDSISFLHRPLTDEGTSTLRDILEDCFLFIDSGKAESGRTLVFCRQAQSRSPSIVIAYLMAREKKTLRDAYLEVLTLSPHISPHESYFLQLQDLDLTLFGRLSFTEDDRGGSVQAIIRKMWES